MSEDFGTSIPPLEEPKRSNTTAIIITVVVLAVLCCCCVIIGGGWYLWTYGDQIFGLTLQSLPLLI
ncbi:MAG TPA: hypothetical protein VLA49_17925 [Anaerolineales bacterium]|nr:hypothetical protein [Anaerolineales bacterium]